MSNKQLVRQVKDTCTEFCAALTQDEVMQFVRYVSVVELGQGEVLADLGEIGDSFYLVIEGTVKLFQVDDDKEFEVGQISPGGMVGEMSFFDQQPRSVRLKAQNNGAKLLEINRQMYNRLKIEEPYISTNLLEFVIRSLDALVRQLSEQNAVMHKQATVAA
ncbi:MAG: Cyclic nucleotide-binding protein [uncultured Thiotrichaceae bacterium]|uniref:Cyclic nucleotide-binding protein n=1 Tax=uncultured Thiotrichaceae bacterium TaxID=298394 RepID=A0A6S6TKY6_9GAMM|nr:MAG: Cyclic nucleotide-binding protein [uncultured Thiotrichaceae bacterium]